RRPTNSLLDMLDGDLRTVIAGALSRVTRERIAIVCPNVPITDGTGTRDYRVRLEIVHQPRSDQSHVLVTFEENRGESTTQQAVFTRHPGASTELRETGGEVSVTQASHERMQSLEGELSYAREILQSTVEELETSNEELQATNEELVSSNEELQ